MVAKNVATPEPKYLQVAGGLFAAPIRLLSSLICSYRIGLLHPSRRVFMLSHNCGMIRSDYHVEIFWFWDIGDAVRADATRPQSEASRQFGVNQHTNFPGRHIGNIHTVFGRSCAEVEKTNITQHTSTESHIFFGRQVAFLSTDKDIGY